MLKVGKLCGFCGRCFTDCDKEGFTPFLAINHIMFFVFFLYPEFGLGSIVVFAEFFQHVVCFSCIQVRVNHNLDSCLKETSLHHQILFGAFHFKDEGLIFLAVCVWFHACDIFLQHDLEISCCFDVRRFFEIFRSSQLLLFVGDFWPTTVFLNRLKSSIHISVPLTFIITPHAQQ